MLTYADILSLPLLIQYEGLFPVQVCYQAKRAEVPF